MKKLKIVFCIPLVVTIFTACSKKESPAPSPPPAKGPALYVTGSIDNVATYWRNGVAVDLVGSSSSRGAANAVAVAGNDVYVAGWVYNGTHKVAAYWKNGKEVNLSDGSSDAQATAIAVAGNDVHTAGWVYNGTHDVAAYWKNGTQVNLSDGNSEAQAVGIAVAGSDVYVAGTVDDAITYWKNGIAVTFTDPDYGYVILGQTYGIAVAGSDIYVVGYVQGQGPTYWKNGNAVGLGPDGPLHELYNTSEALAIAVVDSDVYVAGYISDGLSNGSIYGRYAVASYWKNGTRVKLSDGKSTAKATGIAVAGSDVYVAGYISNASNSSDTQAVYWKNGTAISLGDRGYQGVMATGIVFQ